MQHTRLTLAAVALTATLTSLIWVLESVPAPDDQSPSTQLADPLTGGDFRLDSSAGSLALSDLRGQVVLINFGYTSCPHICPTILTLIGSALRSLSPDELARVQVLFISVDPERDDPQRLVEYAARFHPNIRGITGAPDQIAAAARRYGVAYRRVNAIDSRLGYRIDHSTFTYVLDPHGRLVRTLDDTIPPAMIADAIRKSLGDG